MRAVSQDMVGSTANSYLLTECTAHNSDLPLRFGTTPSLGLKPHSSSARFLPPQDSVPTLTPPSEAQLRGTSVSLVTLVAMAKMYDNKRKRIQKENYLSLH